MNRKKSLSRITSLLLCAVMILGMLPASVFAAGTLVDAAIFCSDVHGNPSTVTSVFNGIKSADSTFNPTTASFVGDTQTTASSVTSAAQGVFSDVQCIYAFGNHDDEGDYGIDDFTGLSYGEDGNTNYYIYTISENDMTTSNPDTSDFTDTVADLDKSKPLFIISHIPLHARRSDNNGAAAWYTAISAAAESMDIAFFWAHNHTGDNEVDQAAYYVAKDGDETMTIQGGSTVTPNFTYLNAGYIDPPNKPARNNVATAVRIYDDSINYTVYNASGELSGTYAVNETVDRKFAGETETVKTLSSIAVTTLPTQTEYTVGDTFSSEGMVVTAAYSDGSTAEVTGYTLSGYDMSTAGTQTVTVTYEGQTAAFEITVAAPAVDQSTLSYITVSGTTAYTVDDDLTFTVTATYVDGTEISHVNFTQDECDIAVSTNNTSDAATVAEMMQTVGAHQVTVTYGGKSANYDFTVGAAETLTGEAEGVTVSVSSGVVESITAVDSVNAFVSDAMAAEGVENYSAYDITPTIALKAGNYATISLPVAEDAVNPVAYYVSDDGETIEKIDGAVDANGDYTFRVNHFSTYVMGYSTRSTEGDSGDVTLGGTTTTKTVYVLTSSISSGNSYLIVNGNSAGSYHALAKNGSSVAATGVTVKTDSDIGTYIELDDATDELWTASGSSSTSLKNGSYYLTYSGSKGNYSLILSTSSASWTYSSNRLSIVPNRTTYYLVYDSGWDMSSSSDNVYFYVPTEITSDSTVKYTMRAEDLKQVVDTSNAATLTAGLDYCLQGNGTDLSTLPSGGSYSFTVLSDESDIIDSITDGTVKFTGKTGTATVKVAYTWTDATEGEVTVYKNITVETSEPYYTLDITKGGTVVTGATITEKGVASGTTLQLGTEISYTTSTGTADLTELPEGATLTWAIPEEYQSIATIDQNGLITFKGVDGAFYVMATLTINGKDYTVGVNISATTSQYSVPEDGTTDFPEYPNEGAIRYDKTATAVGNFSETGIAQVELSMTGVPYSSGSEIDVVVMLDMSTSMDDDRIAATVAATKVFVESIVKNTDGSYNSNRIYVGYFNGDTAYTITGTDNIGGELATVDNDTEYNALIAAIEAEYDGALTASGTNYDVSLEECYNVLTAAKTDGIGNDRDQYVVFMSDGGPTDYATSASNVVSESTIVGWFDVSNSDSANWTNSVVEEYWSGLMKDNGVSIYSVGLILQEQPTSGPQDYRSYSADQNYYVTSTLLTGIASGADYFINCESATDTAEMEDIFSDIATKILQAATDVTVEDKIADEYTMIFGIPTDTNYSHTISTSQEFYIEFVKYTLDENNERSGDPTTVTKLYLIDSNGTTAGGTYSAGSSATDAYAAPVFAQTAIGDKGTLYYWTTDESYSAKAAVTYTNSDDTYYFIPYGMEAEEDGTVPDGWYNMTSGAYAFGNIDAVNNTSTDLVIATPYFVYNASTKMLYWTVDKLDTTEYALRYFLYLDNSATDIGESTETPAGSYLTNDHAYITYTNFKENDCRQEFPKPQLTWNGAQVHYVFYLVNAAGQPINKSGQVVDFANATFVTERFTKSVVWNRDGDTSNATGTGDLSANWLAEDLLPTDYTVYDPEAGYVLNVYEKADGTTIKNQFTIKGGEAADISAHLNEELPNANTTASTVSTTTTKVYNTKAGEKVTGYGTYTSDMSSMAGIDFANTTVAFAVVWQPALVPDTVVVDFGLDVVINVVQNDLMQNTISGIGLGNEAYGNTEINTGVATESKLGTSALTIDGNTITIENENSVRFSQGDMLFSEPVVFYYESPVAFYENSDKKEGYMYSSVTVIPATSIYYEEDFILEANFVDSTGTLTDTNEDGEIGEGDIGFWELDTKSNYNPNATQDVDRPGANKLGYDDYDADNIYGYDSAYTNFTEFSLGSAMKVTVNKDTAGSSKTCPNANFRFTGTGFDLVSMTNTTSGVITVIVNKITQDADGKEVSTQVKKQSVDTYYGYVYAPYYATTNTADANGVWSSSTASVTEDAYKTATSGLTAQADGTYRVAVSNTEYIIYGTGGWVVDTTETGSIWQVPVIKIEDLDYGTYDVKINVLYSANFDHRDAGSYSFWLDAIRIYDPAQGNTDAETAHKTDGEQKPDYVTLRDLLVDAETLGTLNDGQTSGVVFIDGKDATTDINDYANPGPNHETYLAYGQGVSFKLVATKNPASTDAPLAIHIGAKLAFGNSGTLMINGEEFQVLTTATDMYYDMTDKITWSEVKDTTGKVTGYESNVIVLSNGGTTATDAVISITNLKAVNAVWDSDVTLNETPVSIAISGETNYTVGDALALVVTATYADGSTKVVTASANLSGYDMSTAGTYTVTATYGGQTDTCEITVAAADESSEASTVSTYSLRSTAVEETETAAADTSVASYSLRSTADTAVTEEETEETSRVISLEDTGRGFRMKLSGVRGHRGQLSKMTVVGGETKTAQAAEASTYALATTSEVAAVAEETEDTSADTVLLINAVVDAETVETGNAVLDLQLNPPVEPETPDPFVPEYFETEWKNSKGNKAILTITTSEDVESITINGQEITKYKTVGNLWFWKNDWSWIMDWLQGNDVSDLNKTYRVWTYTVNTKKADTTEYEVIAYDADGLASEPVLVEYQY